MLGGPIIAGETLSRFFAIHVFIVPGMLIAFVGIHLLMVLKLGVNEWPMPGRVVNRASYLKEYAELTQKDGVPFVPDAFRKDLVFSGLVIIAWSLARRFSDRSAQRASPIRPSCKRCHGLTTSSFGLMLHWR
jgi:ubiquinol-cytochrome c reductase cytochrome b subunit